MSRNYLAEAFEQLDLIDNGGEFSLDKKGVENLEKFMEDDVFNDFETVIDPEATTEDELKDSYIGMGILGCEVCHSMIYKPVEEITVDEETQMANVGECCPYCYERDGFKIIGKVAPFEEVSVEVTNNKEDEEVPEPTVKVNGKDVPVEEAPAKEEEALTAEQKYPVQSPISEDINSKIPSKRKLGAVMESVTTKLEEELSNSEKLFRAFPELREPIKESINEGMEDISITTDDQVIKVKATPRTDKETIVPIQPEEVEQPVEEEAPVVEEPVEPEIEGDENSMDVELEEIDSESFDELGESYLKKVYENVAAFKTLSGTISEENKLMLEGLITFNSGKKAKTNFIFEAKEVTRKGKVKFVGLNENLSKNKKAFTLTGSTETGHLVCEQLNYNYLGKDSKTGSAKRLYGTIKAAK